MAETPDGSPEPKPKVDLVRPMSTNDRKLPEPDDPRRHTVRLVSPETRRNVRPNSGWRRNVRPSSGWRRNVRPNSGRGRNVRPASVWSRNHEPFSQSENVSDRYRGRSPLRTRYELPICVPTGIPTGITRTSWSLPLSGGDSRTNRTQLRKSVGALNPEFAFAGATRTTRGPVAQNATTTVFGDYAPWTCLPMRLVVHSFPGMHIL